MDATTEVPDFRGAVRGRLRHRLRPRYTRDRPGMSAFAMKDGAIYHTYSTYARGLDGLWGAYQWLDRAPLGRNETRHLVEAPRRVHRGLSAVAHIVGC